MKTLKKPLLFSEIEENSDDTIMTGNVKFDSWFSRIGGMVRKSVVFLTGTSGAGKTTTMMNLMEWCKDIPSSFYERECDLDEVKSQIKPFYITHKNAHLSDAKIYPFFSEYMEHLWRDRPLIVIVDSLQAIATAEHRKMKLTKDEAAEYIREELTKYIKEVKGVLFLIGHNTKEGEFSGKNTNMQMVDAHMVLEFDKKTGVRKIYWGQKNRKGPMKSMYYSINDGKITFFNEDEYTPEVTSTNLNVNIPVVISPKEILDLFVNQFKEHPLYTQLKKEVNENTKIFLKQYKETYQNEFWKAHAYIALLSNTHDLAVARGMITLK